MIGHLDLCAVQDQLSLVVVSGEGNGVPLAVVDVGVGGEHGGAGAAVEAVDELQGDGDWSCQLCNYEILNKCRFVIYYDLLKKLNQCLCFILGL